MKRVVVPVLSSSEPTARVAQWEIALLGGFSLRRFGSPVDLPLAAQRVLALLAMENRAVLRAHVARTLWVDAAKSHADGNLRTALWRIRQRAGDLVTATRDQLAIAAGVLVDLLDVERLARELGVSASDAQARQLGSDLLPDWDEDWIYFARERFRQVRMRLLEATACRLSQAGEYGRAVDAAVAAVAAEPLRESANRVLIEVHVAEGNLSEAVRQFRLYERLLARELGAEPSDRLRALVLGARTTYRTTLER